MFVPIRSVVAEEKCLSLQFSEMLDRAPCWVPNLRATVQSGRCPDEQHSAPRRS